MQNKTQTKDVSFVDVEVKFHEGEEGVFSAYGSIFGNIDRDGDIILPGAFTESINQKMPKLLWQHDMKQPIGTFIEAREDDRGLLMTGKLASIGKGPEVRELLKMGALDGMSIGFLVKSATRDDRTGIRTISQVELLETSLVTFPANEEAVVFDVKSKFKDLPVAAVKTGWQSDEALLRIKEATDSETYCNAFLKYDVADLDNLKSYALPIADVIDGELKAVPKAIFAAAASISGSKSIDNADKPGLIENIERYYEKMGRESPFQKGMTASEVREASLDEIAQMLFNGTKFARSGADWIIKQITRRKGDDEEGRQSGGVMEGQLKEFADTAKNVLKQIKGT